MYSPFTISENNHVWQQEMVRREKILARRLEINPVDDMTMRDLERGTLRHRFGTALASLVRRPSVNRTNPLPEVSASTNN